LSFSSLIPISKTNFHLSKCITCNDSDIDTNFIQLCKIFKLPEKKKKTKFHIKLQILCKNPRKQRRQFSCKALRNSNIRDIFIKLPLIKLLCTPLNTIDWSNTNHYSLYFQSLIRYKLQALSPATPLAQVK